MAAFQTNDDNEIVASINVTPLVDIVLVLLVIFMVTAKLIAQQGIPMDLPRAASASATQAVLTVSLDERGNVFTDGKPVSNDDELRRIASEANRKNPALRTVLQAAGNARHAKVLHVLDQLRESGVTRIAFAADPAPKDAR
jgi:biopolymer transport protein ExbD